MSAATVKRTDYDDVVDAELSRWPGVTATRQVRGKHYALVLEYNGWSRFVIYPCSPGDGVHGAKNHLGDVRKALRDMGAVRKRPQRSTSPRRVRNRTSPANLSITRDEALRRDPTRNPWEALQALKFEDLAVAPRRPWWKRTISWIKG